MRAPCIALGKIRAVPRGGRPLADHSIEVARRSNNQRCAAAATLFLRGISLGYRSCSSSEED